MKTQAIRKKIIVVCSLRVRKVSFKEEWCVRDKIKHRPTGFKSKSYCDKHHLYGDRLDA